MGGNFFFLFFFLFTSGGGGGGGSWTFFVFLTRGGVDVVDVVDVVDGGGGGASRPGSRLDFRVENGGGGGSTLGMKAIDDDGGGGGGGSSGGDVVSTDVELSKEIRFKKSCEFCEFPNALDCLLNRAILLDFVLVWMGGGGGASASDGGSGAIAFLMVFCRLSMRDVSNKVPLIMPTSVPFIRIGASNTMLPPVETFLPLLVFLNSL